MLDTDSFTLTADFHIDVSDRIGSTSNFYLTDAEVADLVSGGFDAAESVRNFRFFTNAFVTSSRGVDVVTTYNLYADRAGAGPGFLRRRPIVDLELSLPSLLPADPGTSRSKWGTSSSGSGMRSTTSGPTPTDLARARREERS